MLFGIVFSLGTNRALSAELRYFESQIDFWGESKKEVNLKTDVVGGKNDEVNLEKGDFPWKKYLDPKNKEFFKEGDYTPPEPFMEIARNPTDDNLKQWFDFIKKKNELSSRLQARMQEYLLKNQQVSQEATIPKTELVRALKNENKIYLDPTRFRLRMYFESTCPHCRRMFGVLKQFQNSGYSVEALQVDKGSIPEAEKIVPISTADQTDLKKHNIKGVPFLLIADTKRKGLLPAIEGFHDYNEIIQLLEAASR